MNTIDWRKVIVGSMMGVVGLGVVGCAQNHGNTISQQPLTHTTDPDARAFQGTIVSLRPARSEMLISKDEHVGNDAFPNIIQVKWDANTQFFLDDHPTTLDRIERYMNVSVAGRMKEGEMFATQARFSSVLPANVRRGEAPRAQN